MNVVITGGSRGIGAEAVRRFTALGHQVAFLYEKHHEAARAVAAETGARAICCDVSDEAAVAAAFAALPDTDLLITCAGIAYAGLIQDTTEAQWDRIFDVNVKGVYRCIQAALPDMLRRNRGCIVTLSSMWGQVGASCESHYAASKAAVIALTQSLAKELGPSGIRVNCVAPGVIETDMTAPLGRDTLDALAQDTPLCRNGTPDDVARAISYLCSDAAAFVTGHTLSVNGGFVIV